MKSEVRENQVLQQTPSEGETLTGIVEVIPDVFTDLWVRYGDGSWRWVDLTLLAETQGFQTLRDLKLFRQARISRSKLAIEWPGGLRLSVQGLVGASNELNDENVYVRAVSDTAYGWFRPLMVSVPRRVERKHLPTQVREKGLSDFEVLEWLGFSRAQLQRVLGAYPRREEVSMTRLLDLVMYLTGPTRAGVVALKQWLTQPWRISSYLTPEEAITHGQIAYVERLWIGKTILAQNFTKNQ